MLKLTRLISACAIALFIGAAIVPVKPQAADDASSQQQDARVIYHINDSEGQALGALRSMRNHLDVAPGTEIVVVTHAEGIEFLTNDYPDTDEVAPLIAGLASRGVIFEVCEITMDRMGLEPDDFLLEADFTPSGVKRLVDLQTEGYAYIKP